MDNIIIERIHDSIEVKQKLLKNERVLNAVSALADVIVDAVKNKHKLIICGNGGSSSDALHFAGELVGRFQKERPAWPVVVLNADVATMTAVANDYGYEEVFARQAQAHVTAGDVFVGISASGNSQNVYRAVEVAREKGAITAAFLGKDGGRIGKIVEHAIIVPCMVTARIQECHIMLIHILCEIAEDRIL